LDGSKKQSSVVSFHCELATAKAKVGFVQSHGREKRWAISREYKNKLIIAASVKGLKEYAILIIAYVRH